MCINIVYFKIFFVDVVEKFGLLSVEDAEFVVAKAIRDGNVDVVIDYLVKVMYSKEIIDVYSM